MSALLEVPYYATLLTIIGAGIPTMAIQAIRVPPHPHPSFTNMVVVKSGMIHATTERAWLPRNKSICQ